MRIALLMCLFLVFGYARGYEDYVIKQKELERQHFTYELKVDALKKLGFRYCIKNFVAVKRHLTAVSFDDFHRWALNLFHHTLRGGIGRLKTGFPAAFFNNFFLG